MQIEKLQQALTDFFATSPLNRVSGSMAFDPVDVGQHLYETPIIGVGDAEDPMWEGMKRPEAIGEIFKTPKEWMPQARTVISYFAPFSDFVITGNMIDSVDVGNGWLYAYLEGQAFLHQVNHFIERWFAARGITAFAPYSSDKFEYVYEPGTNPKFHNPDLGFTSNWSERHAAYICGLGTFGLQKAIITERGVCGRCGSIITDFSFPVTPRKYTDLYEYCLMCGACTRCPAKAISLKTGKSHHLCSLHLDDLCRKHEGHDCCGKCYVNVPCSRHIPVKRHPQGETIS